MLVLSSMLTRLSGVRHAFSTREGGVSGEHLGTLNLARTVGDAPENVEENRRRFGRAAGFDTHRELAEVSQVHGVDLVWLGVDDDIEAVRRREADGLLTEARGRPIGVRTADCGPVLLVATDGCGRAEAVAAVHAGWRSAVGGILGRSVEALTERGARPERIYAAVGPCIGPNAFEVGEEVVEAARASLTSGDPRVQPGPRGRPLLDLPDLLRQHLVERELRADAIEHLGMCTFEDEGRFFSHRRDRGRTGRHLSCVSLEP